MKKFFSVIAAALVIALGLWIALRVEQGRRGLAVAELLPARTLFLAQLPNLRQTREQWHASDLYALWREPAVQAWLQEPLARLHQEQHGGGARLAEFLQLNPTKTFLAVTSIEGTEPKLIGGFHFDASAAQARRFVEAREARLLARSGSPQRETITYREHQIKTMNAGHFAVASVFDRNWFVASNDLSALEALLDRADHRAPKESESLQDNAAFVKAMKALPAEFAGMFFLQPQPFLQRLMPLLAMAGQGAAGPTLQRVKQVDGVAGALGFDRGKMTESIFIGMPLATGGGKLARPSLAHAGADTFFYAEALTHWADGGQLATGAGNLALPAFLQPFSEALAAHGVTREDLRAGLGDEVEVLGEWPSGAHGPQLLAAIPVQELARAKKIADALTSVPLAGATWTRSDRGGVSYYETTGIGGFVSINPTLAVSAKALVLGTDTAAVEGLVSGGSSPADALEKSATFRGAIKALPAPETGFNYIDTRLFFTRADAALRPLLLMSATIYPALGGKINANNLPPAEAIAKHLTPIVRTQRYNGDGYLSQSRGPITFDEAAAVFLASIGGGYAYLHGIEASLHALASPAPSPAPPSPAPAGSPSLAPPAPSVSPFPSPP